MEIRDEDNAGCAWLVHVAKVLVQNSLRLRVSKVTAVSSPRFSFASLILPAFYILSRVTALYLRNDKSLLCELHAEICVDTDLCVYRWKEEWFLSEDFR